MPEPEMAATKPVVLDLEPGTYLWCACGRSEDQPWCDGSHAGTGFEPIEFTVTEAKRYAMCACKRAATAPFCDGTHKQYRQPPQT